MFWIRKGRGFDEKFYFSYYYYRCWFSGYGNSVYASPVSDALRNGVNNKATGVDVSSCGLTVNQANTEYTDFVCSDDKAWMLQNVAKYEVSGDKVVKVILDTSMISLKLQISRKKLIALLIL